MTRTIDTALVTDLLARQNQAIDEGDAAGWAATYTPDGSFHSPTYGDAVVGTDALVRFAGTVHAGFVAGGIQQRHWLNNVMVDAAAGTARSYLMIVRIVGDAAPTIVRHVVATDEFAFHDGELKVRSRVIRRDG